jgi:hypothetical protein
MKMEKMRRQLPHVEPEEVEMERVSLGSETYIQPLGLLEAVEVLRQSLVDRGGQEPLVELIPIAVTMKQCNDRQVLVGMWV